MAEKIVITFHETDSNVRVTRKALANLDEELGMPEIETVRLALPDFVDQVFAKAHLDDGPLSTEDFQWVQTEADKYLAPGPRIWVKRLF